MLLMAGVYYLPLPFHVIIDFQILMTLIQHHVKMVGHVWMALTSSPVLVRMDLQADIVRIVSTIYVSL